LGRTLFPSGEPDDGISANEILPRNRDRMIKIKSRGRQANGSPNPLRRWTAEESFLKEILQALKVLVFRLLGVLVTYGSLSFSECI
jgi:hypothetical protein